MRKTLNKTLLPSLLAIAFLAAPHAAFAGWGCMWNVYSCTTGGSTDSTSWCEDTYYGEFGDQDDQSNVENFSGRCYCATDHNLCPGYE